MTQTKPKLIALDCETEGLRWYADKLHGFAIAYEGAPAKYFTANAVPQHIADWLADPEVEKVGHRVRFDLKFLRAAGYQVRGRLWCTKILAHLLDENSGTGLKELANKFLPSGSLADYTEMQSALTVIGAKHVGQLCSADLSAFGPATWTDVIARYCEEDARNTLALFSVLGAKLRALDEKVKQVYNCEKGPLDYYVEESMPAEAALLEMELPGIALDVAQVENYGVELRQKLVESEVLLRLLAAEHVAVAEEHLFEKIKAKYKTPKRQAQVLPSTHLHGTRFNWNSTKQLKWLLFTALKLKDRYEGSTDERALSELRADCPEVIGQLLKHRGYQKLLGTYVEGLLERQLGGRIYAEYTPFTTTGRLTSENPNMQNIPRGCSVKRAFVPNSTL